MASEKKRITDFTNPKITSFQGKVFTATELSFSPDGTRMVAYLQTNLLTHDGMTVFFDLQDIGSNRYFHDQSISRNLKV